MTEIFLAVAIVFGILILALLNIFGRKFHRRVNQKYFYKQWNMILSQVKTPEGRILAIIDADKLLDQALRRSGLRGKTVGERLVAAQRKLSDNDAVWYAHKLRNRLVHEPNVKLKKSEAQLALTGFRQGLRDLGAL